MISCVRLVTNKGKFLFEFYIIEMNRIFQNSECNHQNRESKLSEYIFIHKRNSTTKLRNLPVFPFHEHTQMSAVFKFNSVRVAPTIWT